MSKSQQTVVEKTSQKTVVNNADFIVEELSGFDEFHFSTIAEEGSWKREILRKFARKNIIVSVRTEKYDIGNGNHAYRKIWQMKADALRMAEDVVENRNPMLPCGHSGIRNLRDGDFECHYRGCSRQFERINEEFEEA